MRRHDVPYRCPATGAALRLEAEDAEDTVHSGTLVSPGGERYTIVGGIPDLTYPRSVTGICLEQKEYYDNAADDYDRFANLTFAVQNEDEDAVRRRFADLLHLSPNDRVLEVSCGTGRDSVILAERLGPGGSLFLQDLSRRMLARALSKLGGVAPAVEACVSNACYLPFPDRYFDAVYGFGGLSVFPDIPRALAEMARVVKPGGRVVVGDESMAPWLYGTEFGKILLNNNPLFQAKIPFEAIPVCARDVAVRWVIGGVYYLIDFTVGEGEPQAQFDLEIPGRRGGTLRTRYYGKLEGVTPAAKELACRAAERSGQSLHSWLDAVVRAAAGEGAGEQEEAEQP